MTDRTSDTADHCATKPPRMCMGCHADLTGAYGTRLYCDACNESRADRRGLGVAVSYPRNIEVSCWNTYDLTHIDPRCWSGTRWRHDAGCLCHGVFMCEDCHLIVGWCEGGSEDCRCAECWVKHNAKRLRKVAGQTVAARVEGKVPGTVAEIEFYVPLFTDSRGDE